MTSADILRVSEASSFVKTWRLTTETGSLSNRFCIIIHFPMKPGVLRIIQTWSLYREAPSFQKPPGYRLCIRLRKNQVLGTLAFDAPPLKRRSATIGNVNC